MRPSLRLPVAVHVPVAGSYSSALRDSTEALLIPPATSTSPFGSNVAVCMPRAVWRLLVGFHLPATGIVMSLSAVALSESACPPLLVVGVAAENARQTCARTNNLKWCLMIVRMNKSAADWPTVLALMFRFFIVAFFCPKFISVY